MQGGHGKGPTMTRRDATQLVTGGALIPLIVFLLFFVRIYRHHHQDIVVVSRHWRPHAQPSMTQDWLLFLCAFAAVFLIGNTLVSIYARWRSLRWPRRCFLAAAFAALLSAIVLGPSVLRARQTWAAEPCVNNVRMIMGAKDQYVYDHGPPPDGRFKPDDISAYVRRGFQSLECPFGGLYEIGGPDEQPRCTKEHI